MTRYLTKADLMEALEKVRTESSVDALIEWGRMVIEALPDENQGEPTSIRYDVLLDCIEEAWGIIANASGGDWKKESDDWNEAAERWRDKWVAKMSAERAERKQEFYGKKPEPPCDWEKRLLNLMGKHGRFDGRDVYRQICQFIREELEKEGRDKWDKALEVGEKVGRQLQREKDAQIAENMTYGTDREIAKAIREGDGK